MPDRTATPEELLDQWLDALNEPGAAPPAPAAIADLAGVALDYRRALAPNGTAAASPERNGRMHHVQTLATPNGTSWRIVARPKRRKASWSSWLATAAMIALLAGLVGGAAVRTWGLPGGNDLGHLAGVAASPGATPAGTLSCASPGYAPVIAGDATQDSDVDLGGPPIEWADSWIVVPTESGPRTLSAGYPIEAAPGAYVSWESDSGATVTSTVLNESWEFPALRIASGNGAAGVPFVQSVVTAGPYVIGPTDPTGVDYRILDIRSGDEVRVSDLLDGSFPWTVSPQPTSSTDSDDEYQAVQFVRTSELQDRSVPEQAATGDEVINPRMLHDTVAVVLPGSVADAVAVDVSDISGASGNVGKSAVVFDSERGHIAWRGWSGTSPDEARFGFFVAERDNLTNPITFVPVDTPAVSLPIALSPDGATLYVLEDNTISAIAIPDGTSSQVASGRSGSTQDLAVVAINNEANTALYSLSGRETWLLDTATGETSRVPALDGYILGTSGTPGFAIGTRFDLGTPGQGSTRTEAVIDTATGAIVATNTEPTVDAAGAWSFEQVALSDRYVAELDAEHGAIRLNDRSDGRSWTMELPEVGEDAAAPPSLGAEGIHTRLLISPDQSCLVLNVDRETGREGNAVQSGVVTEHVGTWIAPLEPDATWTKLPFELLDWWPVPTDGTQTLPAQDFATPAGMPESAGLSCASPGYRAIVRGPVDAADLALVGGDPIDVASHTITAANGTEISFDADEQWLPYFYPGASVVLSGKSVEDPDTVTSLVTGQSWPFPDLIPNPPGGGSGFALIGPWLILPADGTATDWHVIDTMTGNERLTSEIFGAPFAKPHSTVTIGGPWAFDGATPAIVGFPADEGGDTAGLVLPSSDLDDAWALPREHVLAAGTGAITADGSRIAYLDTADNDTSSVVVLDGFTGQQLGFYHAPETDDVLQVVGLTGGDSKLILRDNQQVWTVDLATGEIATAFDPDGDIHELAFDPTTGTAIASAGDDAFAWLDPATGAVKALDIPVPLRFPQPHQGWALIQARGDNAVEYALLDMATGELAAESDSVGRDENGTNAWITGGDTGVFVIQAESGRVLVLDGPGGRSFALATPEQGTGGWSGIAIGVSPDAGCLVYTRVGEGDTPGTSWIAPLEPDADWTELPFELAGWIEVPEPATAIPGPASLLPATPVATLEPDVTAMLPDGAIPILETDSPDAVDQGAFGTVRGTGPTPPPGITLPLPTGDVLELPDAIRITQLPLTTIAVVTIFDTSRETISLATGKILVEDLPPAIEGEQWAGHYLLTPNHDGTVWTITDVTTGERVATDDIGGQPFPDGVTPLPAMFGSGDLARQLVLFIPVDAGSTPFDAAPTDDPPGGTLVIPGSLNDARFLQQNAVSSDGLAATAAFAQPDGAPALLANVTDAPDDRVRIEHAVTGEVVAAFSDTEIGAEGPVFIAGFDDNGTALVVWSRSTVSRLSLDGSGDVTQYEVDEGWVDLAFPGDGTLLASVNPFYDAPESTSDWRLLDLDTGEWRPLPELDGYRYDRISQDADIIVLSARHELATAGIVLVNLTSGRVLAGIEDVDVGTEGAKALSRDGSVYVITGHTGDEQTTGYVVDAASGESWRIEPPAGGRVWYGVSPDGSLLTASTDAGDGWIAPVAPDADWTPLPEGRIVDWLVLPEDG